jgi:hypothetical protein
VLELMGLEVPELHIQLSPIEAHGEARGAVFAVDIEWGWRLPQWSSHPRQAEVVLLLVVGGPDVLRMSGL